MNPKDTLNPEAFNRLIRLGGEELLQKLLNSFLERAPQYMQDIDKGLNLNDFEQVAFAAHTMKASAGNIGAQSVYSISDDIERLAVEHDQALISQKLNKLNLAYQLFRETIEKKMKGAML